MKLYWKYVCVLNVLICSKMWLWKFFTPLWKISKACIYELSLYQFSQHNSSCPESASTILPGQGSTSCITQTHAPPCSCCSSLLLMEKKLEGHFHGMHSCVKMIPGSWESEVQKTTLFLETVIYPQESANKWRNREEEGRKKTKKATSLLLRCSASRCSKVWHCMGLKIQLLDTM